MNVVASAADVGRGRRVPSAITFVPPALPELLLPRLDLQRALGRPGEHSLSLVTGPPGSGKTVIARAWAESFTSPLTWITVDRLVAERERFLHALIVGIQNAHPDYIFDAVDAIGMETIDAQHVVEALADDVVRWPEDGPPILVIIDDAHHLDGDIWSAIEWLANSRPDALHLVIVSRSDPPFSVARLRAQGAISEIRAADLMLERAETHELLRAGPDGGVDWAPWADALHDCTEGWLAGVRLAMLAVERGTPPDRVLEQIGHAQGSVAELLVAEALDRQPPDVREFLCRTSPLEMLHPALCDTVTGRTDSRAVLRRLSEDHLFVIPFDGTPDRYRYHPLLAELLRMELRSTQPDAEHEIHRIAAEWMLSHSRPDRAVDHAIAGAHYDTAFEIITSNLRELYALDHRRDVGAWLLAIPDTYLLADPDRTVDHCGALLFVVRPEWTRWLKRAQAIVTAERPDLRSRLRLFDALAYAGQGRIDDFERCVAEAIELRGDDAADTWDEVVMAWRVRLLTLAGDHQRAVSLATAFNERDRRLIGDLPAMSLLAATLAGAGDPVGLDLANESVTSWRSAGEPDFLGMVDALCVAADGAIGDGHLDEAENLASGAVALGEDDLPNLLTVRSMVALARVAAATGYATELDERLGQLHRRMQEQAAAPAVLDLLRGAIPNGHTQPPPPVPRVSILEQLTQRELTILGYLASHLTFPEIAGELCISRHTVKTHVARIYRKLGVASRSGAVNAARGNGLL
jgi:ATP/maltotriose-dependent transcriptional regulator MalT